MNSNIKGNIGLVQVMKHLYSDGYECFIPFHDYSAIDLIVVKQDKTFRLQVKYRTLFRNKITIKLASIVNGKTIPIDLNMIDGYAVYCADIDHVVFIHKNEIPLGYKNIEFVLNKSDNSSLRHYNEFGKLGEWFMPSPC